MTKIQLELLLLVAYSGIITCSQEQQALPMPTQAARQHAMFQMHVPGTNGSTQIESINLIQREAFTGKTFGELILQQQKNGDPICFVRLETTRMPRFGDFTTHIDYYDAHHFNLHRFGPHYPEYGEDILSLGGPVLIIKNRFNHEYDRNRNPDWERVDSLQYFSNSSHEQPYKLVFSFSHHELYGPEGAGLFNYIKTCQNTDANPTVKFQALLILGQAYRLGIAIPINYAAALNCFERITLQTDDLATRAAAWLNLGIMHNVGEGLSKPDYAKAFDYFTQAIGQTNNLPIRFEAYLHLGRMYFARGNNFQKLSELIQASRCFEHARHPDAPPAIRTEALSAMRRTTEVIAELQSDLENQTS